MLEERINTGNKSFRENLEWATVGCIFTGIVLPLGLVCMGYSKTKDKIYNLYEKYTSNESRPPQSS